MDTATDAMMKWHEEPPCGSQHMEEDSDVFSISERGAKLSLACYDVVTRFNKI